MNDAELLTHLKEQLRQSAGWQGDEIASDRQRALDYYYNRTRGDEVTGRSAAQSADLSAMVEANLAQMWQAFSSNRLVEFGSFGPEDEDQAQLESDTVSYFVMEQGNNGKHAFREAIKDALTLRNGFVKVWAEERRYPKLQRYSGVKVEALAGLMAQVGQDTETKVLKYDPETGELRLRVVYVNRRFCVESVAPENFFYPKDYDSFDLQRIPFCAERHVDRRSDLVELGFPKSKVKELKPYTPTNLNAAARNVGKIEAINPETVDTSQDSIEWYEAYVMYDSDNDGIAERHRVCFSDMDTVILSDDEVNLVPYAAGAVFVNPHRLTGISLWDKLRQTQDLKTGLTRALMDNVNTATKNRTASLDGAVNPDDLADGRTNGNIRVKKSVQDVRAAVMPFTVPDLSAGILQNIQYLDTVASKLGGSALDMQSAQMQLGDIRGSQGIDRVYSVSEALAADMTATMADTLIKNTFLLAHATMRENYDQPTPIKTQGKWMAPVPAQWPERNCIYVKVGMSPGERMQKAAALDKILQSQMAMSQMGLGGGVMVNADGFYKALTDWARIEEIENPERYFVDPSSPGSQQAQQSAAQQAQQLQDQQKQLAAQAVQLEQLRTATDKYKADQDTQFKYWAKNMDVQMKEAEIAGNATIQLLQEPDEQAEPSEATTD